MSVTDNLQTRFELYRIKLIRPFQSTFTSDNLSAAQILHAAINSRPEQVTTQGNTWHIGNVEELPDENALYFAIGRTTKGTNEKFDDDAKNFAEESIESSPHTYCIVLIDLGVAAIAYKSRLAASTQAIGSRIRSLLGVTDSISRNGISVEVDPLSDPKDFIEEMTSAYALMGFTATFRGPNPVDADELFQKPLAQIASVTGTELGQVKLRGADLNRDAIADIARGTAATGNRATAKIRDEKGKRARTLKMEKSPALMVYAEDDIKPIQLAADLRTRYAEVRTNE